MKELFKSKFLMLSSLVLFGFILLTACFLTGCAQKSSPVDDKNITKPKPVGYISDNAEQQGGQLPESIVRQASKIHEGSMIPSQSQTDMQETSVNAAISTSGETIASSATSGITMILGPVNAERVVNEEEVSSDAGQSIREIISQILTSGSEISLFDAPEERFIDDSPRPDLARKGVKFVVKGVASTSRSSGETTVFLRAVNTMTGKIAMVASARDTSRNQAAEQAARNLVQKITGVK